MEGKGFKMVRAKDYYQNPTPAGYRGALTNWRHPNGHVAEVQFIDRHTLQAKEEGHKHYEKARSIAGNAMDREMTDQEQAQYDHHMHAMKNLYDAAWEKNLRHGPMSKAMGHKGHSVTYFDFHGAPAYQEGPKKPAYSLVGGKWKAVNRAAVHHGGQLVSRSAFDRLVAQCLRHHHGHAP